MLNLLVIGIIASWWQETGTSAVISLVCVNRLDCVSPYSGFPISLSPLSLSPPSLPLSLSLLSVVSHYSVFSFILTLSLLLRYYLFLLSLFSPSSVFFLSLFPHSYVFSLSIFLLSLSLLSPYHLLSLSLFSPYHLLSLSLFSPSCFYYPLLIILLVIDLILLIFSSPSVFIHLFSPSLFL